MLILIQYGVRPETLSSKLPGDVNMLHPEHTQNNKAQGIREASWP